MKLLITGASGQLGAYLIRESVARCWNLVGWSGREPVHRSGLELNPVELRNVAATQRALETSGADVVIHAAAMSAAEAVLLDPENAQRINIDATQVIADWCDRRGVRLVFTSTDLVFDGTRSFSDEDTPTNAILAYGRTKQRAEPIVRGISNGLVVRVSLLYGPTICGRPSYFDRSMEAIRRGERLAFFEDEFRTPLDLQSAANGLLDLAAGKETGIVHLAGTERLSRYDLMRRLVASQGLDPNLVTANRRTDLTLAEPRPADVSLNTSRLQKWLPNLIRPRIEAAIPQQM